MYYVMSSEQNREYRLALDGETVREKSSERCWTSTESGPGGDAMLTSPVAATSTGVRSVLPQWNKILKNTNPSRRSKYLSTPNDAETDSLYMMEI